MALTIEEIELCFKQTFQLLGSRGGGEAFVSYLEVGFG